ncbi:MAG: SIR2 family NAD-dependent protein deacylase [Desulfatibacillaceae bacterium]
MADSDMSKVVESPEDQRLRDFLDRHGRGFVVFMTGAGISSESGVPTFRGTEGYWTVGSRNYQPQEAATYSMFSRHPRDIWAWYLYRRTVCARARPNPAHYALANLEKALGKRFLLITQNIDGLHLLAGNSAERTWQIHGNVHTMRCATGCGWSGPFPEEIGAHDRDDGLSDKTWQLLRCRGCGGLSRPHVLWFDECYDEQHFRFESSLRAAAQADLLVVVGTSGATNLPVQVGAMAARQGAAVIDVNPDENPFSGLALSLPDGLFCKGSATDFVPAIATMLADAERHPNP